MKRLMKNESLCVGCHLCEDTCSTTFYKVSDPRLSCIRIIDHEDRDEEIHVCTQCGKCAEVCNTCVINPNPKGVFMLNRKECAGCLMCVGFCPEDVMVHDDSRLEPSKCIACGACARLCPTGAIWIEEV